MRERDESTEAVDVGHAPRVPEYLVLGGSLLGGVRDAIRIDNFVRVVRDGG